jgi:glucosamine-6-phosphate deaminase
VIWEEFPDYASLSDRAAQILLGAVRNDPRIVLGLPTGRSPIGMYERVVQQCQKEYHCFREVTTFNLDEYVGIALDHPGSYHTYMKQHLFDHVDIDFSRVHIPAGNAPDLDAECERYEEAMRAGGGIKLMFLGLGRNGHIGFNEPGAPFESRTRVVELTESTRAANAPHFPDGNVPTRAITMGIATILESKEIVLIVSGSGKKEAIERLRSHVQDPSFPASALWSHARVRILTAIS